MEQDNPGSLWRLEVQEQPPLVHLGGLKIELLMQDAEVESTAKSGGLWK